MLLKHNTAILMDAQVMSMVWHEVNPLAIVLLNTVNCIWGPWSNWEACSITCGGGTEERYRNTSQPAVNDGTNCAGNYSETQHCNSNGCPGNVHCQSCKGNLTRKHSYHIPQLTAFGALGNGFLAALHAVAARSLGHESFSEPHCMEGHHAMGEILLWGHATTIHAQVCRMSNPFLCVWQF